MLASANWRVLTSFPSRAIPTSGRSLSRCLFIPFDKKSSYLVWVEGEIGLHRIEAHAGGSPSPAAHSNVLQHPVWRR